MATDLDEDEILLQLSELFFLDNEPSEKDFLRVAELLKTNHWTRLKTEQTLVEIIAPTAGANLGYLVWPVIGAWSGFDKKNLSAKFRRSKMLRASKPRWYFFLSDLCSRRILRKLQIERLLVLL